MVGVGALLVASGAGSLWAASRAEPPARAAGAVVPVVVELFSSEGCSSCPPADAYLAELDRAQHIDGVTILALEEHVDYWDYLGWRDPFSQATFTARQRQYASVLDHRVYTPEIVVDGRAILEPGDKPQAVRATQASSREPKARIGLNRRGDRLAVDVNDVPSATGDDAAEVWLAVTESGLSTRVERGENAGRMLAHAPVVRALRKLGTVSAGAPFHVEAGVDADPAWKPQALRVVVFVQRVKSRRIVGATAI